MAPLNKYPYYYNLYFNFHSLHPPFFSLGEMMSTTARGRYPFTATQWQELEHQALIYKYMVSGMPVPPDLLYTVRRSLDSAKLILHQPHHIGWNCFQMGFGKKIDPEPGRCRRTDGKKWRCSKEAYPDSKYCERHMHRGRNRSRKPVEISNSTNTSTITTRPPTAIPITKNTNSFNPGNYLSTDQPHQYPFLYPHSSSSRPRDRQLGAQSIPDHTTKFLFDSAPYGMKEEVDEHVFFSESSGAMRSSTTSSVEDNYNTWQLLGSPMKQSSSTSTAHSSYLQLQPLNESSRYQMEDHHQQQQQPKKVMHHFFDEWPPKDNKDSSWLHDDSSGHSSKTQLSISIPNSSQDFFINRNGK